MSSRTIFLSRLLGLYCILAGLFMITRGSATVDIVIALVHDAPLIFFVTVVSI